MRFVGGAAWAPWLVIAASLLAMPAAAAPDRRIVVVEAHIGERTRAAAAHVGIVLDELEARGFAARADSVLAELGTELPRPGLLDHGTTRAEISQQVDIGYDALSRGKFEDAVVLLTTAIERIHRNPALLVLDNSSAKTTMQAYVGLALSEARLGRHDASVATMGEVVRAFPQQPVSRGEFGPQAESLYRAVYKQLQPRGRGSLQVSAGTERALIFVDGQIRGAGSLVLADLLPGTYRVFVQIPGTAGRQYLVDVRADVQAKLEIDLDTDAALWVDPSWVGFLFASAGERERESRLAAAVTRRWHGGGLIGVVGAIVVQGKPAVIGTLYQSTGQIVRSAMVATEGTATAQLRLLARFLADGTPFEGLAVVAGGGSEPAPVRRDAAPARASSPGTPYLLTGVGMMLVGFTLYATDRDADPGESVPFYRNTAAVGVVVGAAGVVALGVGVVVAARHRGRASAPLVSVSRDHAMVGWAIAY